MIQNYQCFNADCMEFMKKMPDKCVEMTLTDIPYDIENNRFWIVNPQNKFKTDKWGNKYKARDHATPVLRKDVADSQINTKMFDIKEFLDELYRITKGTIIVFCGQTQVSEINKYFRDKDEGKIRQLILKKTNGAKFNASLCYLSDIENAVLYKFPNATFNTMLKSCVFEAPCEPAQTRIHPTEKPHKMIRELILDNTNKGDLIFDPCMGSASTILLAVQLGRKGLGVEIDKEIYNKAMDRLKDQAIYQMDLLDDYKTKEEIKAERDLLYNPHPSYETISLLPEGWTDRDEPKRRKKKDEV